MIDDLMDEPPVDQGPQDDTCSHTYFDGRSAVTQVKWSDKGFIGRCNLCGSVIEQ